MKHINSPAQFLASPSRIFVLLTTLYGILLMPGRGSAIANDLDPARQTPRSAQEAVTITLGAAADTYLDLGHPTIAQGTSPYLWLHNNCAWPLLLRFDLSGIPKTARILNATLSLYADQHSSWKETIDPFIMPVTTPWDEVSATWLTASGATRWQSKGGDYDYFTFSFFDNAILYDKTNTWHTADITNLTQFWVDGSRPNYGMMIDEIKQGSSKAHRFVSREGPEELRPNLKVTYVDQGAMQPADSFLHPGIAARADSHVYQHLGQNFEMLLADLDELGAKTFWPIPDNIGTQNDAYVNAFLARGIDPVVTISLNRYTVDGIRQKARELAAHYKGRVKWYNAHGEINNAWYDSKEKDMGVSPQAITEKIKALSEGVKSEDPEAKVAFAQLGSLKPEEYLKECVKYGLAKHTDAWGSGFSYGAARSFGDWRMNLVWARLASRRMRWALAEGLKEGHVINYQEEGMMRVDEADQENIAQAKVIAWKTVMDQQMGSLPNEWYKLYDPSPENYQLVSDDFKTKYRGFYAIKYLNRYLNPREYVPSYMGIMADPPGFFKFAFKKSNEDVILVVWDARKAPTNSFDSGTFVELAILDYGLVPQSVIDPITGEVVDPAPPYRVVDGKVIIKVEIVDYPRLIQLKPKPRHTD